MHPSGEKLYIADTNNHQIKVYDFRANTIQEVKCIPVLSY